MNARTALLDITNHRYDFLTQIIYTILQSKLSITDKSIIIFHKQSGISMCSWDFIVIATRPLFHNH